MKNKKMIENMKKQGVKSVAGILVAATLMGTAVPALAEPVSTGATTCAVIATVPDSSDVDGNTEAAAIVTTAENTSINTDSAPAASTEDSAPAASTEDSAPAASTEDSAPAASAEDSAPAASTDSNAPAPAADKDKEQEENKDEAAAPTSEEEQKKAEADAKAAKAAEEEKKKTEEAEEKAINKAGAAFADLLIDASKMDFSSHDETAKSIGQLSLKTIKLLNDKFSEKIPYVGGAVKEIVNALMDKPSSVDQGEIANQHLKEIIAGIDKLNSTVEISTNKLLDAQQKESVNKRIEGINEVNDEFFPVFREKTGTFNSAITSMSGKYASAEAAETFMRQIYNTDMTNGALNKDGYLYYDAYIKYMNSMMNQKMVKSHTQGDAFALYDSVAQSQSNYIAKFNDERTKLVDNVQTISDTGYIALKTAMGIDLATCINTRRFYQQKVDSLYDQIKKCTDPDTALALQKELDANNVQLQMYIRRENATDTKLTTLNNTYIAMSKKINNQNARIKASQTEWENFSKTLPEEVKTEGGTVCKAKDVIISSDYEDGELVNTTVHAYPRISEDKTKVEYIDAHNNVVATEKINKGETTKNMYAIQADEEWTIVRKYEASPDQPIPAGCTGAWETVDKSVGCNGGVGYYKGQAFIITEKIPVHVNKVEEVAKDGFFNIIFKNTTHVITGINKNTGKEFKFVDDESKYRDENGNEHSYTYTFVRNETMGKTELTVKR